MIRTASARSDLWGKVQTDMGAQRGKGFLIFEEFVRQPPFFRTVQRQGCRTISSRISLSLCRKARSDRWGVRSRANPNLRECHVPKGFPLCSSADLFLFTTSWLQVVSRWLHLALGGLGRRCLSSATMLKQKSFPTARVHVDSEEAAEGPVDGLTVWKMFFWGGCATSSRSLSFACPVERVERLDGRSSYW